MAKKTQSPAAPTAHSEVAEVTPADMKTRFLKVKMKRSSDEWDGMTEEEQTKEFKRQCKVYITDFTLDCDDTAQLHTLCQLIDRMTGGNNNG